MIAPAYNYIESDFESADETVREYRARVAAPPSGHRFRRAYRRITRRY
jgi:hypothetical protein